MSSPGIQHHLLVGRKGKNRSDKFKSSSVGPFCPVFGKYIFKNKFSTQGMAVDDSIPIEVFIYHIPTYMPLFLCSLYVTEAVTVMILSTFMSFPKLSFTTFP